MNFIFSESPDFLWNKNATVGGSFTRDYSYSIGYQEAGDLLVKNALELHKGKRDSLFYPICFIYRHFLEITLKELIKYSEDLYQKSELLGLQLSDYSKPNDKLETTHSLEKLINRLICVLKSVSEETFDEEIKSLILDFHNIDPNGQRFRYTMTTRQEKSFNEVQNFNIENIKESVNTIANYFMGIDGYLCHYTDLANNLLSDYQDYN